MKYSMDLPLRQLEDDLAWSSGDTYARYNLCRCKAEYLMRLMFAVTVDVALCMHADTRVVLVDNQFTMGTMTTMAKRLFSQLKTCKNEEVQLLRKVWDIMDNIRDLRNDDAHGGTSPEEMERFIQDNENWFREVWDMTDRKYFQLEDADSGYRRDLLYIKDGPDPDGIRMPPTGKIGFIQHKDLMISLLRRCVGGENADTLEGQLYLWVERTDGTDPGFYRLSPFILREKDTFLLYQNILQSLNNEMTLQYTSLRRQENMQRSCSLTSLIPKEKKGPYFVYRTNTSRRLEINLRDTSDNGSQRLANHNIKYCEEVCPQWKEVLTYCQNRSCRYCVICGEGGLGKTALAIHIINDCILKDQTDYKRVIFLSAKEYYPEYQRPPIAGESSERQVTPDFRSYREFLLQMRDWLLPQGSSRKKNCTEEELEEKLLHKINIERGIPDATLLVVDDLDSLPPQDQRQVIAFINHIINNSFFVLVTTRSEETSGLRIRLSRLDRKDCLTFIRWYTQQKKPDMNLPWDEELLCRITEGRPYDLQHLANLICARGRVFDEEEAAVFRQRLTPRERTFYLCRTSLQQLSDQERVLFRFLCELNSALCGLEEADETREETDGRLVRQEIPVRLLCYLQIDGLELESALTDALSHLQDVCLLERENSETTATVRIRQGIAYTALLESDAQNTPPLPDYLHRILERVRKGPDAWRLCTFIDTLLIYLRKWSDEQQTIDLGTSYERRIVQRMCEDEDHFTNAQLKRLEKIQQTMGNKIRQPASFQAGLDKLWKDLRQLSDCLEKEEEYDAAYRRLWESFEALEQTAQTENEYKQMKDFRKELVNR